MSKHPSTSNSASSIPLKQSKPEDCLHSDDYFMASAVLSSKRSKDPSTQVGVVIVNEDNRIVAIGHNKLPSGCKDDDFPWYRYKDVKKSLTVKDKTHKKRWFVLHAEANAILNKNCDTLTNTRLYTTLFPCMECTKLIVASGITKVLYQSDIHASKPEYRASRSMLEKAGIVYELYTPQQDEIVINM